MAEKSNKIVAIPKLLDLLVIEGAIVSIDAMGCQRDIVKNKVSLHKAVDGDHGRIGTRAYNAIRDVGWLQ